MAFVEGKTDVQKSVQHLRSVIESIRAAQAGQLNFAVSNNARDVKASNEASDIFYYQAVNDGRKRIIAEQNAINAFPKLHFKVSAKKWKIVKSVRASSPRRITDRAMQEIRKKLPLTLEQELAKANGLVAGVEFSAALDAIKKMVLEEFKKATLELAVENDSKRRFYGVEATPLADSFFIVDKKT